MRPAALSVALLVLLIYRGRPLGRHVDWHQLHWSSPPIRRWPTP